MLSSRRRWIAYAVLLSAGFMDLLDATVVNVAVSSIQQSLGASLPAVQWVIASYMLAFGLLLITGGRLGDLFGRRRLFLLGIGGFTTASLLAGVAPGIGVLVAARAIQGAAAAMMVPQILAMAQTLFNPAERGAAFGLYGAVTGLAAVAGPLLGGALVHADLFGLGWRPIFLVNVPVGLAAVALTIRLVPESRAEHARGLDLGGVMLLSCAMLGVLFPLVQGAALGSPSLIAVMVSAAAALFAWFVRRERALERSGRSPLVPPSLFRERPFAAGLLTSAVFFGGTGAFFMTVSVTLQLGLGYSAMRTGLVWVPFSIAAAIGSGMSIAAAPRLGRRILQVGTAAFALGIGLLLVALLRHGAALAWTSLIAPMIAAGFGMGFVMAPLVDVILVGVCGHDAGAASGILNATGQIGQATGIAAIGMLYFLTLGAPSAERYVRALSVALAADLIVIVAAGLLMFLLPARRQPEVAIQPERRAMAA